MSGSGRTALLDVRDCLGDPPVCPEVVWRPSRIFVIVQEALPDVRDRLGGPPGCPGVVGRPSQIARSGRQVLQECQELS